MVENWKNLVGTVWLLPPYIGDKLFCSFYCQYILGLVASSSGMSWSLWANNISWGPSVCTTSGYYLDTWAMYTQLVTRQQYFLWYKFFSTRLIFLPLIPNNASYAKKSLFSILVVVSFLSEDLNRGLVDRGISLCWFSWSYFWLMKWIRVFF